MNIQLLKYFTELESGYTAEAMLSKCAEHIKLQRDYIFKLEMLMKELEPACVVASDHYFDLHGVDSPLANKYNELITKIQQTLKSNPPVIKDTE